MLRRKRPESGPGAAVDRSPAALRFVVSRRVRRAWTALALSALLPLGTVAHDTRRADQPAAISRFNQKQLDARGIETIRDLQLQPPSVVPDGRSELTVRGVGAALFPAGQSAVTVAQDGVTAARAAPIAALLDLERIEIERGPVGPIDGRSVGGAARLTTRRPSDAFAAGLDYELGSRVESRLRATLNAPLADDRAAARLAVLYGEERGSYGLLTDDERDSADEDLLSVRTSLRYRLAEDVLADASWTFTRMDAAPLAFATGSGGTDSAVRTPAEQAHFATLGFDWQLGDFVVVSNSGYQSAEWSQRLGRVVASDDVRVWSSRLELRFDDGGPFRVRMGLGYWDEKNDGAGERPASRASLDPPSAFAQTYARTVDGFTDVTYEVLPGWRTHAGFRIAYDERKRVDRSADSPTVYRRERNPVTWRVGSGVEVGEHTLLYGTIGTADRPGTFDLTSAAALPDEDLLAYQLGAEQRLAGDRVCLDLAAFYYDYDDVQTVVAAPGFGARAASLPAAESYGVELESSAEPTAFDGLVLDGEIGWLHTRIDRGRTAGVDLAGGELPLAPQLTAHIGVEYTVELTRRVAALPGAVTARFDYAFRDRMYFDAGNRTRAGAWDDGDLRLIYQRSPSEDGLRVEAFAENLWDERAAVAILPLRTAPDALLSYNEVRTFGVRLSRTFR